MERYSIEDIKDMSLEEKMGVLNNLPKNERNRISDRVRDNMYDSSFLDIVGMPKKSEYTQKERAVMAMAVYFNQKEQFSFVDPHNRKKENYKKSV